MKQLPDKHDINKYNNTLILIRQGKTEKASRILKQLLTKWPEWQQPLFVLCELLIGRSVRSTKAEYYKWIERLNEDKFNESVIPLYLLSLHNEAKNEQEESILMLKKCLEIDHTYRPALQKLAVAKIANEEWCHAEAILRDQLILEPQATHLLTNISICLLRQNKLLEALGFAINALKNANDSQKASVYLNIGTIYQELGKRQESELNYKKALRIDPSNNNALVNLGVLALQNKNFGLAEEYFRNGLSSKNDNIMASVNLAGVLLLTGQFEEGWKYYEKRLHPGSKIFSKPVELPLWSGNLIQGALVLVHEQGLGDSFQFIRYAKILRDMGMKTYFCGPQKLHGLFINSGIVDGCYNEGDSNPKDARAWIALMSLPGIISRLSVNSPNINKPYLLASKQKIKRWNKILGKKVKPRIALHWQGNPNHEFTISRGRSLEINKLLPLLELKNIDWISLQKGPGSEETLNPNYLSYWHTSQEEIENTWDFEDAAAILKCCDGLISSDSGLAHLAGALGIPVMLMLPWLSEWRWGFNGAESSWYPRHRLYRQIKENSWDEVIKAIKTDVLLLDDQQ